MSNIGPRTKVYSWFRDMAGSTITCRGEELVETKKNVLAVYSQRRTNAVTQPFLELGVKQIPGFIKTLLRFYKDNTQEKK